MASSLQIGLAVFFFILGAWGLVTLPRAIARSRTSM